MVQLVRNENKEDGFWLAFIADTNPTIKLKDGEIIQEAQEITAIVSSIINKMKK